MKDTQEMVADTLQERICEHTGGKVVDVPRACIMKDIREVIVDSPQEPFCERTGEQIGDGLVARVTKEILEAPKDIPLERIGERTGARQVDLPFSEVMEERVEVARLIPQEQIVAAVKVQHILKEIVDVCALRQRSPSLPDRGGSAECPREPKSKARRLDAVSTHLDCPVAPL